MRPIKYRKTYKISSARIQHYDYSQNGAYFVTICTQNKRKFFGEIMNEKMFFSNEGEIACNIWEKLPEQFDDLELGEWIIMPNHMHGIIIIDSPYCVETQRSISHDAVTEKIHGGITQAYNPMLKQSLSSIVRWFKGRTAFEIRKESCDFAWQARFYEHVIRNEKDFNRVSKYIAENPIAWGHDEYFI